MYLIDGVGKIKKLIFILFFISTNSFGQVWIHVVEDKKGIEYYVDQNSIRPNGDLIFYSQLSNYPEGRTYNNKVLHSTVQSRLTDCIGNKFKTIGMIGYSDFDGKGDTLLVSSTPDREWVVINMNKITGDVQREVCK